MKSKLFEEEGKPFFLGYLVFGTFVKRWPKRKKLLEKKATDEPVIANEITQAISATEKSMAMFIEASKEYKAAAAEAKKQYDNHSGTAGKVKGFFGFEQGDPDKKIFDLGDRKFLPGGGVYSMNDILSPDFNIGLFLEQPLEGDALKAEVLNNLFGFREYYDTKSSEKMSRGEIEDILTQTIDTYDPFKTLTVTESDGDIQVDLDEISEANKEEIKELCKPKADNAFVKFQQSMKTSPTQVNLVKQKKILINNPYYAIYRDFKGYSENPDQVTKQFPELLKSAIMKLHQELYDMAFDDPSDTFEQDFEEFVKSSYAGFWSTSLADTVFGNYVTVKAQERDKQMAAAAEAESQKKKAEEKKKVIEIFTKKAKEFIKDLQRIVPVFIIAEKPENPLESTIEINSVYNDTQSELHMHFMNEDMQIIKQIALNQKPDYREFNSSEILELAKRIKTAIRLRDMEVFSDLANMKEKADLSKSKAMSRNLEKTLAQIEKSRKITNDNLKTYKIAIDWLKNHKQPSLFTANPGQRQNLEEQITELIKPLIRDKLKRKQNGKKNLCN
jgi:hypothetical protein